MIESKESTAQQSTEEIKKHWDSFAAFYSTIDQNNRALGMSLLNLLKIEQADSIIEPAVGAGLLFPYLINLKKKQCRYVGTDLSPQIISVAEQRLQQFRDHPFDQIEFSKFKVKEFQEPVEFPEFNITLRLANNEDLSFAKDGEFEVYFSNLSLHLVADPEKMLKEAYRILKKGGRIGVSVLGRTENSLYMSMWPKIIERHGIEQPKIRSPFQLNDRDKLIKMFENAGFKDVLSWQQFNPFRLTDGGDVPYSLGSPSMKKFLESNPDKTEAIKKDFSETIHQIWRDKKHAIGLEALMLIAKKD